VTTTFKAGDKVRVLSTGYTDKAWIGVEGIVQGHGLYANQYKIKLTDPKATGLAVGYLANLGGKLELVEPSFTFADIQVGDTIRRTQTFKSGATEVREGTVGHKASWYAEDGSDYILAYDTDDKPEVTLELLNRPEPEPVKEVWEDAKVGDVFKRVNKNGKWSYFIHTGDGWDVVYENGCYSKFGLGSTHLFNPLSYVVTKA